MAISRVCYVTREQLKRAGSIAGPAMNFRVDRIIQAVSRDFETQAHTWFVPRNRAWAFPLTLDHNGRPYGPEIPLPGPLLSLSSLTITPYGGTATPYDAAMYRLEPITGPPYKRITMLTDWLGWSGSDPVINTTGAALPSYLVTVTGIWADSQDTAPGGALVAGIDNAVTALGCTDASLIGVGDSILIGSEQLLVTERAAVTTGTQLDGALTANMAETIVTVDDGSKVNAGETITVDGERMFVEGVDDDDLIVIRQYDGSTLAAHEDNATLYVDRSLTVLRAQGGTAAAAHSTAAPILVYQPPDDARNAMLARAIATIEQEQAGYGRVVGTGEGARPYSDKAVMSEWQRAVANYFFGRVYVV